MALILVLQIACILVSKHFKMSLLLNKAILICHQHIRIVCMWETRCVGNSICIQLHSYTNSYIFFEINYNNNLLFICALLSFVRKGCALSF